MQDKSFPVPGVSQKLCRIREIEDIQVRGYVDEKSNFVPKLWEKTH